MESLLFDYKKLNQLVKFYCINYKDEYRREKMAKRWSTLGLELKFVEPVEVIDHRLNLPDIDFEKRTWSIMLQHLDSIRDFVESTDAEYCIVCEDDIVVSKHIANDLPEIIQVYESLSLDVLLMGYLVPYRITDDNHYYPLKSRNYKYSYHDYPDDLWGSQMYMVSRKHAITLLNKYTVDFAIQSLKIPENLRKPFSPDWAITKFGNKSIIYPMIALEEGDTKCNMECEISYHQKCFKLNYTERVFL
jgi:hypothetical protein